MNIQHQTKCSIAFIRVLILIWLLIINSNDLKTYLRLQLSRNKVSMDSVCCQSSLWQSFGVWEDEGGPFCGELSPISKTNQRTGRHSYPLPSFIFTFLCLHSTSSNVPEKQKCLIVAFCWISFHYFTVNKFIFSSNWCKWRKSDPQVRSRNVHILLNSEILRF